MCRKKAKPRVMCGTCGKIFSPRKKKCPNCKKVQERNEGTDI